MAKPQKKKRSVIWKWVNAFTAILGLAFISPLFAPQLLAFPHQQMLGDTAIYSDTPITSELANILEQSDALLRQSAIFTPDYDKTVVLTNGGWRWSWLSLGNSDAFALNRTDIDGNKVYNGSEVGGARSLSSLVAHERTHALIRQHFGFIRAAAAVRAAFADASDANASSPPQPLA